MRATGFTIGLVVLLCAGSVWADDVFHMTGTQTSLQFVTVGDPGNVADTRYAAPGYGAVAYTYNIGKYDVTAGQYTAFLNAVGGVDTYALYDTVMSWTTFGCGITRNGGGTLGNPYTYSVATDFADRPVNYVSFWDSCRFINWLCNGQPTGAQGAGTTETGAYTLNGYKGNYGSTIQRNAGAKYAVPSENEWYKAAYYKGGSTNAGYWDYATRSSTAPGQDMNDVSGNNANYFTSPWANPFNATVVGQFKNSPGPYGTFDQDGNVWQWNEAIPSQPPGYADRGMRGGSFYSANGDLLASGPSLYDPTSEVDFVGFRVVEVPEPATLSLLALGGLALVKRRRR